MWVFMCGYVSRYLMWSVLSWQHSPGGTELRGRWIKIWEFTCVSMRSYPAHTEWRQGSWRARVPALRQHVRVWIYRIFIYFTVVRGVCACPKIACTVTRAHIPMLRSVRGAAAFCSLELCDRYSFQSSWISYTDCKCNWVKKAKNLILPEFGRDPVARGIWGPFAAARPHCVRVSLPKRASTKIPFPQIVNRFFFPE